MSGPVLMANTDDFITTQMKELAELSFTPVAVAIRTILRLLKLVFMFVTGVSD